jgi:hypothetical protein
MQPEEYLDTKELARRIKMAPGTIRNMVWRGDFKLNVHYVKPTRRKVLFIWSAVEVWLYGGGKPHPNQGSVDQIRKSGLINI